MVVNAHMLYLFQGPDSPSKDSQLKAIRKEFLPKDTEQFNLDILYARDLNLSSLQEKCLTLAVNSKYRLIIIKDAQNLKNDVKEFLLSYAKNPYNHILLILDVNKPDKKDEFLSKLSRFAKVFQFKEEQRVDGFNLNRQIMLKRADNALKILNQLLQNGEKPERLLGALRYAWEHESAGIREKRMAFSLLLKCDSQIKTGQLKPTFAIEKLVVSLCGIGKII